VSAALLAGKLLECSWNSYVNQCSDECRSHLSFVLPDRDVARMNHDPVSVSTRARLTVTRVNGHSSAASNPSRRALTRVLRQGIGLNGRCIATGSARTPASRCGTSPVDEATTKNPASCAHTHHFICPIHTIRVGGGRNTTSWDGKLDTVNSIARQHVHENWSAVVLSGPETAVTREALAHCDLAGQCFLVPNI
jgi:hypothetical protein